MIYKEVLSTVAMAVTFIAFLPYILAIYRQAIRPHVFSWIIWGATTFMVFLAQMADGAGVGAWPIGLSGLITTYIAVLAFLKRGDYMISRQDWLLLLLALSAMPFWYLTTEPLWAVIILTVVDVIGFAPTFSKVSHNPYEEQLLLFVLMMIRNILVIMALENYSLTTVLFPAVIAGMCLVLILFILEKRRALNGWGNYE